MIKSHNDRVREFMLAMGQPVAAAPTMPLLAQRKLRTALLMEEVLEFAEACGLHVVGTTRTDTRLPHIISIAPSLHAEASLPDMYDALCDIDYVCAGGFVVAGLDQEAGSATTHQSNMSKLGEDGRPILDGMGKVQKGPNYWKVDYALLIEQQLREVATPEQETALLPLYIMRVRDQGFCLVGPFGSEDDAFLWGAHDQMKSGDDPRWQTLRLAQVPPGVLLVSPDQPVGPD